jgi:hypothetical protein
MIPANIKKEFEKSIDFHLGLMGNNSIYNWMLNQDHIPFDLSVEHSIFIQDECDKFLDDVWRIYHKDGHNYFWFIKGHIASMKVNDNPSQTFDYGTNFALINVQKIRELKLKELIC